MTVQYGKLRPNHIHLVEISIHIFKQHNLHSGLHGTSLWNSRYKDIDLVVWSQENNATLFKKALQEVIKKTNSTIINEKGNESIGFDYEISVQDTILHLSFVILL